MFKIDPILMQLVRARIDPSFHLVFTGANLHDCGCEAECRNSCADSCYKDAN